MSSQACFILTAAWSQKLVWQAHKCRATVTSYDGLKNSSYILHSLVQQFAYCRARYTILTLHDTCTELSYKWLTRPLRRDTKKLLPRLGGLHDRFLVTIVQATICSTDLVSSCHFYIWFRLFSSNLDSICCSLELFLLVSRVFLISIVRLSIEG